MITRSKRKNASTTTLVTEAKPNNYLYTIFVAFPMYTLFTIAFYFMVNNIGYNTVPAGIYLFCGSSVYASLLKDI
jgi:hypothetical protein